MNKESILESFPSHITARHNQVAAMNFIGDSVEAGSRYMCLDAPVGVGKSYVAAALAIASGSAGIIVPSKALQTQYINDMPDFKLSRGRGAYPCTYGDGLANGKVIRMIRKGEAIPQPPKHGSCATAPCMNLPTEEREVVLRECVGSGSPVCPYTKHIEVAAESAVSVHNQHSFFFQTYHSGKLPARRVLILDEAHDTENFIRGQASISFTFNGMVSEENLESFKTVENWVKNLTKYGDGIADKKSRQEWRCKVEKIESQGEAIFGKPVIFERTYNSRNGTTTVVVTPSYVGGLFHTYMGNFATDHILFMSGTILNKSTFLSPLGISASASTYKQLVSDFPASNRPVVLPTSKLDLSFKNWDGNLSKMGSEIQAIMAKHPSEKGIIFAPSYKASLEIQAVVGNKRTLVHGKENFAEVLANFHADRTNKVFISPIISQGLDFKNDLARFSIHVRPPYLNASDKFVKHQTSNGRWDWYNYKSAQVFLQQLGRGVRSNTDYCKAYLIDYRYHDFIRKNNSIIPAWQQSAFIG